MIVATLATLSSRESTLRTTIASLVDQVDCICVYLNGHARIPSFLKHPKVAWAVLSSEHGIRGAEAKLLFYDRDEWKAPPYFRDDDIALTCDDDIAYPTDYVARHLAAIEKRPDAISCVHASVIKRSFERWHRDRRRIAVSDRLDADTRVHVPGTGTMAFRRGSFDVSLRRDQRWSHCVDVMVAIAALKQGVEVWSIARPRHYMAIQPAPDGGTGIYRMRTGVSNDEVESRQLIEAGPWPELDVPWR